EHHLYDLAADIFEIDIDPLRRRRLEGGVHSAGLVVDAGVEAELGDDIVAFRLAAGDADDAAALELGDLPDDGADRTAGGRDHDGFARLRLADFHQAVMGGAARHAEDAQSRRDRRHLGVEDAQFVCFGDAIFLPAQHAVDAGAFGQGGDVALDHLADRAADHQVAGVKMSGIGAHRVHAAAHIGVERQVDVAHQHLVGAGRGNLALDDLEILLGDPALGVLFHQDLSVFRGHFALPVVVPRLSNFPPGRV